MLHWIMLSIGNYLNI